MNPANAEKSGSTAALLVGLNRKGIELRLAPDTGKLQVLSGKGTLSSDMADELRQRKPEIVAFFTTNGIDSSRQIAVASVQQQQLWSFFRIHPQDTRYNEQVAYRISGPLDVAALVRALRQFAARHEVFRTAFVEDDGLLFQLIRHEASPAVETGALNETQAASTHDWLAARRHKPFDLAAGEVFRAGVFDLGNGEHLLVVDTHHITVDFGSLQLLQAELTQLYAIARDSTEALPAPRLQYADYSEWQKQNANERLQPDIRFWKETLQGAPQCTNLPTDRARPAELSNAGASFHSRFDGELLESLTALGRRHKASLFVVLQSLLNVLLYRISGDTDIVTGTVFANRDRDELADVVGNFLNLLPFRHRIDGAQAFDELLRDTQQTVVASFEHQSLPFEQLIEAVKPARNLSHHPVFQVMLALQNQSRRPLGFEGCDVTTLETVLDMVKFELAVVAAEDENGLLLRWEYSTDLFDLPSVRAFADMFATLARHAVAAPETAVNRLPLLEASAAQELLGVLQAREPLPEFRGVVARFEDCARRFPDNIALRMHGETVSYAELDARVTQLAAWLQDNGALRERGVAVRLVRSIDLVVALLAVLKSGAAWLPVDAATPLDRLRFMLEDAGATLLLTDADTPVGNDNIRVVNIRDAMHAASEMKLRRFPAPAESDLAYVIYTSGSTGKPKGVAVEHGALERKLAVVTEAFGFTADDSFPNLASHAFDISLLELLLPLVNGGETRLLDSDRLTDLDYLVEQTADASFFHAVPSLTAVWLNHLREENLCADYRKLRCVLCGGDAVPARLLQDLVEALPEARIVELYGPTEATIISSYHLAGENAAADVAHCIGKRFKGASTYVVDETGALCPPGVPGELCIGGHSVARGYLNRPELDRAVFVADPFADTVGARMYRSGDRVRLLHDGRLEFLGRIDNQVKIRGFRVEPGEIEKQLAALAGVEEAAVIAAPDPAGELRLLAYVTGAETDIGHIRAQLAKTLPPYMLPGDIVHLDAMPLNPNGKIDRKALPRPESAGTEQRVEPAGETETKLAQIWQELLHCESVGAHDNFFALGGQSLLATRLVSRIRREWSCDIQVRTVFERQTLREQAEWITATGEAAGSELPPLRRSGDDRLPLSYQQQRLYLLEQMQPGRALYNVPLAFRLHGAVNADALQGAMQDLVARHEVLRSVYLDDNGQAYQQVLPDLLPEFQIHAWDGNGDADEFLDRIARAQNARAFALDRDCMLRAALASLNAQEHVLLLTLHHIASDGWSAALLADDIGSCYAARCEGRDTALPELPFRYADYAAWQREADASERMRQGLEYWQRALEGVPEVHNLPLDRPRPAKPSYRGETFSHHLDAAILHKLEALARRHEASLAMLMQAAFSTLLHRHSGDTDIVLGTPVANRDLPGTENLVGFFVNTVLLRTRLSGEQKFSDVLAQCRETALAAFEHQHVPFDKLVDALRPARDLSHNPLFQVMLAVQNNADSCPYLHGLACETLEPAYDVSRFDLTLNVVPRETGLLLHWEFATDLFDNRTVQRMAARFAKLLAALAHDADCAIARLPLMTDDDARELRAWNDTDAPFPASCMHELIEAQCRATPDAIAVQCGDETLSYAELDARSARLANVLRDKGVGPDTVVGLHLYRGIDMVVGILGILRAGGAWLPLDPELPAARIGNMLEDAAAALVLSTSRLAASLPASAEVLAFDGELREALAAKADRIERHPQQTPEHLAYVIFTSGSTGRPKGVMVPHAALVNRIHWMHRQYGMDASDAVLQKTPFSFDVSVWEFCWPLMTGARLVMARPGGHRDPEYLCSEIVARGITTLHFVPSMLRIMLECESWRRCTGVRNVFCSGEALPRDLEADFFAAATGARLHNLYGPTEAAIDVTYFECGNDASRRIVPIGRAIDNTHLYMLDRQGELVPPGVTGELCIGGAGLARGYINRPELTAERFIETTPAGVPDRRLYRSGDLARFLPDGNIEFLGRFDHQVKIRGFRIELGEIEAALLEVESVSDAVVMANTDAGGSQQLLAYVVAAQRNENALRQALAATLPDYMQPSIFMFMDALPLSANGKIDRKALPAPDSGKTGSAAAPATATETALAAIWRTVLGEVVIGREDNFFRIGGNSLLATRLAAAIRRECGVEFSLRNVFEAQTLMAQAALIGAARHREHDAIPRVARQDAMPVSHAQQQFWLFDRLNPGTTANNMFAALRLNGNLDVAALEQTFNALVKRHESLRTTYHHVDGMPVQRVEAEARITLPLEDLAGLSAGARDEKIRASIAGESEQAFDLARDSLLRVRLLRCAPQEHILLISLHHIASDGWSNGLLRKELSALYRHFACGESLQLEDAGIQYADYAAWQRSERNEAVVAAHVEWWKAELAGAPELHELPLDFPRPAAQSRRGGVFHQRVPAALSQSLKALAESHDVTLFMLLHAAFAALLHRYSRAEDIVLGTTLANREHAQLANVVGLFMNPLPLRLQVEPGMPFSALLAQERERALAAFEHQQAPFDRIVEAAGIRRGTAYPPLIQIMLILQNNDGGQLAWPGISIDTLDSHIEKARLDLILDIEQAGDHLDVRWEYCADLFAADSMAAMSEAFHRLLEEIVAQPETRIGDLRLLNDAERRQLLDMGNHREWSAVAGFLPVHRRFAQHVAAQPNAVASRLDARALSYAELGSLAGGIAARLRALGIEKGDRVAVLLERSPQQHAAFMGILHAGAVYIPVDPEHPDSRVASILRQAAVRAVLASAQQRERLRAIQGDVLLVDADTIDAAALEEHAAARADDTAYIIFTSGSTGEPKGVAVSHGAIDASFRAWNDIYRLDSLRRHLQMAGAGFDVCIGDMVRALCSGGELVICRKQSLLDPAALHALLREHRIEFAEFVPAVLRNLVDYLHRRKERLDGMRYLVAGSDTWHPEDIRRTRAVAAGAEIVNSYGLTEAAVDSAWHVIGDDGSAARRVVPVGRPLPQTSLLVLGPSGQPCPIGMPGELAIAGPTLAQGYLDQAETERRFVPHPFLAGERIYRSGDMARWRADGELELLGRMDRQFKLRGFRIEPGEIESRLAEHADVRECVVEPVQDAKGEAMLAAYVVASGKDCDVDILNRYLSGKLPEYMVPAAIVVLDAMPLNANGKIDRRALPVPDFGNAEAQVAPETPTESALAESWCELLNLETVSVTANFFRLGGHSLLAARLAAAINTRFSVDLPIRRVFELQNIRRIAAAVDELIPQSRGNDPIPLADRKQPLPLSFGQQRLWVIDQLEPGNAQYNIAVGIRLNGALNVGALQKSLDGVLARHEVLRTHYADTDGEARQVIRAPASCGLTIIDLTHLAAPLREEELQRQAAAESAQPFRLDHDLMLRARLMRLQDEEHVLLVNLHHIAADGWSMGLLTRDLASLYREHVNGESAGLPALSLQYADFAVWQRQQLDETRLARDIEFWREELHDAPALHSLPLDRPRPAHSHSAGRTLSTRIDSMMLRSLKDLAARQNATLFGVLETAFSLLLARQSGEDDIVFGTPVANRDRSELANLVGFFVNTVVLRSDVSGNPSFTELLARNMQRALRAWEHQQLPFERLVDELQVERSNAHHPLFQILLVLQNNEHGRLELPGLDSAVFRPESVTAKFDLTLDILEMPDELELHWEYATALFDEQTIEQLAGRFHRLLTAIVAQPEARLGDIDLLADDERQRLREWSGSDSDVELLPVHRYFSRFAEAHPECIAVVHGERRLSAAELERQANRLARRLRERGAGANAIVGLSAPRSIEQVVGLLGVLKAGAAYAYLDLALPPSRLQDMIEDAGIGIVVGDAASLDAEAFAYLQGLVIDIDSDAGDEAVSTPLPEVSLDDLAYIIFTSGTTGRPKGVMQTHRTIANLVAHQSVEGLLAAAMPGLQFASLSFDVSIQEFATAWFTGSPLLLLDEQERSDPARLLDLIGTHEIGRLFMPPAMLALLAEEWLREARPLPALREIVAAGEALRLTPALARMLETNRIALLNHYGPSETHVVTHEIVTHHDSLPPIGRPITNHRLLVIDRFGRTQLPGVVGELLASGAGVARGYLQRDELTAERFITLSLDGAGRRFYRTGDLVRYRADGRLDYIGRADQQVKIRGFRVETGEIETRIKQCGGVAEAHVAVREDRSGNRRLVAYVVFTDADTDTVRFDTLRAQLKQALPDYMIPAAFVRLQRLPVTRNGKIDQRQLPEPAHEQAPGKARAPRNELEAALAGIWQELLGLDAIGIDENFFALGGHSILAVQLVSRIRKRLERPVELRALLDNPTVAELAAYLQQNSGSDVTVGELLIAPASAHAPFPLTDVQQAYWLGRKGDFALGNIGTHSYIEIPADQLDVPRFEAAWNRLVQRHEMLRMIVTPEGDQKILQDVPAYRIAVEDVSGLETEAAARVQLRIREEMSHHVFSGEEWPLFAIRVTRQSARRSLVHISVDALALDAASVILLGKELLALYQDPQAELPSIDISFRDYVLSEQRLRRTDFVNTSRDYWLARLTDFPGAPELPFAQDPSEIAKPHFSGRNFLLDETRWQQLKALAAKHNVTPTVLILTCFGEVLRTWNKQPRFALNLTLFNRIEFHEQVDALIGDFTSLTLLELDFRDHDASFSERIAQVQKRLWADLEHKYFNGMEVQRALSRQENRSVTFPVVVTSTLGIPNVTSENSPFDHNDIYTVSQTPQVWLDFQVSEVAGALSCNWDSVDGLFPDGLLDAMFGAFTGLLERLAQDAALWDARDVSLLPASTTALIAAANDTNTAIPDGLLHDPLLERMIAQPDAIAVITRERRLSYRELGLASQQLAAQLKTHGARANRLVAVLMDKGWEQLVAVLGILRAGEAYLPIDASLPPERIRQLLALGEVEQVVTVPAVAAGRVLPEALTVHTVDAALLDTAATLTFERGLPCQAPTDLAYVIFTSGSTGTPKGVMIDHRGALNTVIDINTRYGVSERDTVLGLSSLSFDLSVYDIFGVLGAGGRLVLPAPEERRDPQAWLDWLEREQVTLWNTVPALMQMLVEYAESREATLELALVMMSGDWIPTDLPRRIRERAPRARRISLGGATEASIWSIAYPITQDTDGWRSVPYGTALANQRFYVLKSDLSPAPVWVPGELYIGGIGLALGYWKDAAKTGASFVTHPVTGERLYRTGDLGRWLPDGNIEFLGREDAQVKVQGYRIELGEIEARLKQHPRIHDAVVNTFDAGKSKQLVAYIVATENAASDTLEVGADGDGLLVDPRQRKQHILSQPALRRDLHGERHAFPAPRDVLSIKETAPAETLAADAGIDFASLGEFLAAAAEHRFDGMPLPKRFYPSAGGIYPVQLYLDIPDGSVDGLSGGTYYYDPAGHALLRTGEHRNGQGGAIELHLVGDTAAIRPMYGDNANEFCMVEAGYLAQLLQAAAPAGIALDATPLENPNLPQALRAACALKDDALLLCRAQLRAVEQIQHPGHELALAARKSYRSFPAEPITGDAFMQTLQCLPALHTNALECIVWVRERRIENIEGGTYRFDPRDGELTLLDAKPDIRRIFALSEVIETGAAFAIFFVGASGESIRDIAGASGKAIYQAGHAAQALMNSCARHDIGLCAIGIIDQAAFEAGMQTGAGKRVVSSFLGGRVTPAQVQAMEVSMAPPLDIVTMLQEFVAQALPAYMVPAQFIPLERIPLSANGKVDRKALPAPNVHAGANDRVEPTTALEKALCEIWQAVLGVENIGITDNFFDCGGDSIRAISVITKAKAEGIAFSVRDIYTHQTIQSLLDAVDVSGGKPAEATTQAFELIDAADRERLEQLRASGIVVDAYPLTQLQQGMIFHNLRDGARGTYHDVISSRLSTLWNEAAFIEALRVVTSRHDILRTVFSHEFDPPLQLVLREVEPEFTLHDLRDIDAAEQAARLKAWIAREKSLAFDPARPAWKIVVHRLTGSEIQYTLACHHALLDGWSVASFNMELFETYSGLLADRKTEPAAATLPYRHYVANELEARNSDTAREYWRRRLTDVSVPWWTGRTAGDTCRAEIVLDRQAFAGIEQLARRCGVQERSVLLAAHMRLMALLDGRADPVTSVVTNCRPELAGAERALGLFLNSLPFQADCNKRSLETLIREVDRLLIDDGEHRNYPLADIQRDTGLDFSASLFTYVNFHLYGSQDNGVTALSDDSVDVTNYRFATEIAKSESEALFRVALVADSAIFDTESMRKIAATFRRIVDAMLENPAAVPGNAELLDPSELSLQQAWNATDAPFPEDTCIHELFEAQVARSPQATAVAFATQCLSYAELNGRANRLARELRARGVQAGDRVGICMHRSIEMVVAIYAVLKAGAAYVPLDPGYPADRIRHMTEDADLRIVLARGTDAAAMPDTGLAVLLLDDADLLRALEQQPHGNLERQETGAGADALAYVIFTSGSTGRPKGVMVEHRALVNRIHWMHRTYGMTAGDAVLQKTPFSFDVSVWEFTWPLIAGARLVIAKPDGHRDPAYLAQVIREQDITTLHFVPSMLRIMLEHSDLSACMSLRQVFCSGEALPRDLEQDFFASGTAARLHNLYGPTEAAIDVSYWECSADSERHHVPIGRPIDNIGLHILDSNLQALPIGTPGELCISGVGLARGYINRPELTAERFVKAPAWLHGVERLYRTGDLARFEDDGSIEYLGRIDNQVKIRGFRIELGEIEACLSLHDGVREAAVLAVDGQLVAYVTATAEFREHAQAMDELREHAARALPEFMVPARFVLLDTMPLSPNGKLDRKALPAPLAIETSETFVAARNDIESRLAGIWQKLLRVERISVDADFFRSGGDSLHTVRMASEIRREFGVELPVMALYDTPTIAGIARRIGAKDDSAGIVHRLAGGQSDRVTLIGVPYAAGDGIVFKALADELPEGVGLCSLTNPRNFDPQGDAASQLDAFMQRCIRDIQKECRGPIVIWGHCVGYATAMNLAGRLLDAGSDVQALYLGGVIIDARHGKRSIKQKPQYRAPKDKQVVKLLTAAGLADLDGGIREDEWQDIVKRYHQDMLLSHWSNRDHFVRRNGKPLPIPVHCVVATDDPLTQGYHKSARHWSQVGESVELTVLPAGGHYFIKTRRQQVAETLSLLIERQVTSDG